MIALDIVNEQQFKAMADLAELRLVSNLEEEHNVLILIVRKFGHEINSIVYHSPQISLLMP